MKSKEVTKVIAVHPEGKMKVGTKFHGNPFSICRDISLKTTNPNLMVALKEKSSTSC